MKTTKFRRLTYLVVYGLVSWAKPACADAVLDWNTHASTAIVGIAQKGPPLAAIDFALVHTAIYDAVNAIAGYPFEPYGVTPEVTAPASPEAAGLPPLTTS